MAYIYINLGGVSMVCLITFLIIVRMEYKYKYCIFLFCKKIENLSIFFLIKLITQTISNNT